MVRMLKQKSQRELAFLLVLERMLNQHKRQLYESLGPIY